MDIKEGKYLLCITRNNGDFHKYELIDGSEEAVSKYIEWKDTGEPTRLSLAAMKNLILSRGILNNYIRPHLFLIDLTFSDEDVIKENTLVSQDYLRKFKRIKRLYKLKYLGI